MKTVAIQTVFKTAFSSIKYLEAGAARDVRTHLSVMPTDQQHVWRHCCQPKCYGTFASCTMNRMGVCRRPSTASPAPGDKTLKKYTETVIRNQIPWKHLDKKGTVDLDLQLDVKASLSIICTNHHLNLSINKDLPNELIFSSSMSSISTRTSYQHD